MDLDFKETLSDAQSAPIMIMRVNQLRQRFHALKSGRRKGRVNMIAQIIVQPKIARLLTDS